MHVHVCVTYQAFTFNHCPPFLQQLPGWFAAHHPTPAKIASQPVISNMMEDPQLDFPSCSRTIYVHVNIYIYTGLLLR